MALPQFLYSPPNSSSLISHKSHLNPTNYTKPPNNFLITPPHPRRRKPNPLRCSAASFPEKHHTNSPQSNGVVELPLFPLPFVLFPGAVLPLKIFEFRHRIMVQTLLHTDLRFGVIYTDAAAGSTAVGCIGEVIEHERLSDDRFFLICKGEECFRITKLVRTKPYLVTTVTWLEDRPSSGEVEDLDAVADDVEMHMKDVIRLSNRLNVKQTEKEKEIRDLRKNLFPTPFSFFVGSTFEGAPREQQALLELEDTAVRLRREKETLRNALNYLTAAYAVKDVFPSS